MTSKWVWALAGLLWAGCARPSSEPLFTRLNSRVTGVMFSNTLAPEAGFNILDYLYFYDGGGVAIGDVNNDSLPDVFFTGNQVSNRLYLNRGSWQFEDVSEAAGVSSDPTSWSTGVTMADINGDGWLDIYVCQVDHGVKRGHNRLYINQKDGTFVEAARRYGLDFTGLSTQAAFFDYDRDGDLDMYLLNHAVHTERSFGPALQRLTDAPKVGDKLFRQDDGYFVSVTADADIYSSVLGYGLGLAVSDLNLDGWPDIYVGNDFHENDYLYFNDHEGAFTEALQRVIGHTSRSTMGIDIADVNNDGLPDIVALDMMPADRATERTAAGPDADNIAKIKRGFGYAPQVARNTLQLHRGLGTDGYPIFSEIGAFAGIVATDWSWSPLVADFDGDGFADLYVTNGIPQRPNDMDYVEFVARAETQRILASGSHEEQMAVAAQMPQTIVPNYAFQGSAAVRFTDVSRGWGLDFVGVSNGAAFGDLDLDGDLDLVVNNINAPALLYRNNSSARFLTIALRGMGMNTRGIGAIVHVWADSLYQVKELNPTRGFQSSSDFVLSFGIGDRQTADSVRVVWPSGTTQILHSIASRTRLELLEEDARDRPTNSTAQSTPMLQPDALGTVEFTHRENDYEDFEHLPLIPHKLSTLGPALATADVNGDGLGDLFLGGAHGQSSALFVQQSGGSFEMAQLFTSSAAYEDVDAAFFDANGDGFQDLYVVRGGWQADDTLLLDQLYLNDGSAGFTAEPDRIPAIRSNGCCVATADYDLDGDMDLYVGARTEPRSYGLPPAGSLLVNDGQGHFTDQTGTLAPGLRDVGMVSAAVWADVGFGPEAELILAGEWMPVSVFTSVDGILRDISDSLGLASTVGLWQSVAAHDWDLDGDLDLFAGNWGMNSMLKAPMRLLAHDFDQDGRVDPVISVPDGNRWYSWAPRDVLLRQLPFLAGITPDYGSYASLSMADMFDSDALTDARTIQLDRMQSTLFVNHAGRFEAHDLPDEVQWYPVMSILPADLDRDGHSEVLISGNYYGANDARGPYDAGHGTVLRYAPNSLFEPVLNSGFGVTGEIRTLRQVSGSLDRIVAARNNAQPLVWVIQ